MKILLVDNYDSFVYNIVGLLQRSRDSFPDLEWEVVRNDRIPLDDVGKYDALILSPGPGIPEEAGCLLPLIRRYGGIVPILGVCLGFQAIGEVYGCRLLRLDAPRHGHRSVLQDVDAEDPVVGFCCRERGVNDCHDEEGAIISGEIGVVGRYHSWVIDEATLDSSSPLKVTSRDEDGNIMSIRHTRYPVFGLQFHPESIITTNGLRLLTNFLRLARNP